MGKRERKKQVIVNSLETGRSGRITSCNDGAAHFNCTFFLLLPTALTSPMSYVVLALFYHLKCS